MATELAPADRRMMQAVAEEARLTTRVLSQNLKVTIRRMQDVVAPGSAGASAESQRHELHTLVYHSNFTHVLRVCGAGRRIDISSTPRVATADAVRGKVCILGV